MIRFLHGFVLRLYPASFRRAWGAELQDVSARVLDESRGAPDRKVSLLILADAIRMLPAAWLDQRKYTRVLDARLGGANGSARLAGRLLDGLRQDVRFTLKQWRVAPAFALLSVMTLAIGIGATVSIFSVVNGVLLRPMPYVNPSEIAITSGRFLFWADLPEIERAKSITAYTTWQSWRAAFPETDGSVGVRLSASVGTNYFSLLGVKPILGRLFNDADAHGAGDPLVLSFSTWQTDFGAARDIVGRRLKMEDRTYTIIGVAPRNYADPLAFPVNDIESAMFRVLVEPPVALRMKRPGPGVGVVMRLRTDATAAAAEQEIRSILAGEYTRAGLDATPSLISAREARTSAVKPTLLTLAGAVAILLLIGCVNAANLLLSRSSARMRELTVRGALGAGRGRIVRQLLTESLLLSCVAGAFGAWLGYAGSRAIVSFGSTAVPRGEQVALDGRVLLFAVAAAVVTALLFGLVPALQASRMSYESLRSGGRTAGERSTGRLRNALVVTEIALAVALTFSAGLLARSLWKLQHVKPGYDAERVLTLRITMTPARYDFTQRAQLHERIVEQIAAQAGVLDAAAITFHPLSGGDIQLEARAYGASATEAVSFRSITPTYFNTMGMRMLEGRELRTSDRAGGENAVVLSTNLAQRIFHGPAVGKTLTIEGLPYRVVGVVTDVKDATLASSEDPGIAYATYDQTPPAALPPSSTVVIRGVGDAHALGVTARAAIRDVDASIPIAFLRTMRDMMNIDLLAPRLRTMLISSFGALAALLAALGIAGVMAYTVAQAGPEISVRMALGARARQVSMDFLSRSMRLTLIGAAAGTAIGLGASRILTAMLFNVAPWDGFVLGCVLTGAVLLALVASWIPARRAARVAPADVLRA